jgi:hypothetical protein
VRRWLAVCAVTAAILAAFVAARLHRPATAMAASSPGFTFRFSSNLSDNAPGCPLGPAATFCNQIPGTVNQPAVFTITFTSAASNVAIGLAAVPGLTANFAASDFTISNNTCAGNFAANTNCTFGVAFSPTMAGLREAALTINNTPFSNVAGTGATLELTPPTPPSCGSLADNAFTFCQEPVGVASAAATFTLTSANAITGLNFAFAPIPGLESEFNAMQLDFMVANTTTCGGSLAAGQSCKIDVAFAPKTAGLRSAILTAADSANDTVSLYLAGPSTTALVFSSVSGGCSLRFFDFCNEPAGGVSAQLTYTLKNTSGTQLTSLKIPAASAAGDFKEAGTSCTAVFAANSTCEINMEFTPTKAGLRQDVFTVTDSAGDLGVANLAGTGDDFTLSLPGTQPAEVSVAQGNSATFNAQVVPDGVFGQNGEQVTFTCPMILPINTSCQVTPCPAAITAGTTANFTIKFATSSATVVAPVPTGGCSSFGPAPASVPPAGPTAQTPQAPPFPASPAGGPASATMAAAAALLLAGMGLLWTKRRRVVFMFATAGLAAALFMGCHHGGRLTTPATPTGATTITLQGNALDASGNPLNAARTLQVILDVVTR